MTSRSYFEYVESKHRARARAFDLVDVPWACLCGWRGLEPSITDASNERELPDGTVVVDRTHLAVCPQCFTLLERRHD